MAADPVNCSVVDPDLGKQAFADNSCTACHGAFDEATGTAPGRGANPPLDVNGFAKFDESAVSLDAYIAASMMEFTDGCDGDAACIADAANIATYLKSHSDSPWCVDTGNSSSEMSSSSETVSSSEDSSSSAPAVSSSSDASSSQTGGSSSAIIVVPSSSSSEADSSSSELASSSEADSSSSELASSSEADSSSSEAASSSEADSSSSEVTSSSEAASSVAADPVDCSIVDPDLGKQAFADNSCTACHGAFDEATGTAPGRGANPSLDVNSFVKFDESAISLDAYIATSMMEFTDGCDGDAACIADAANIATYLKSHSDSPWCVDTGNSSSEMTSSSDLASSSSTETSSSDAAVSSSPDASSSDMTASSEMNISSDMSSSSEMGMSSSSEMVSSSSEMTSSSIPASSSSEMSSSSEPVDEGLVEFIYPTFKANLGGATATKVVLKVRDVPEITGTVSAVTVGGVALSQQGDLWVSADDALTLNNDAGQTFDVILSDESGDISANVLVLNNDGSGSAGEGLVFNATGLGFDTDDQILYFTDSYSGQLGKLNSVTGERDAIYSAMRSEDASVDLYWSMAVDSANDEIYIVADSYSYDSTVGSEEYAVELLQLDAQGSVLSSYAETTAEINGARSAFVDLNAELTASVGDAIMYFVDFGSSDPLHQWILSGDYAGEHYGMLVSVDDGEDAGEDDTRFSGNYSPRALVRNGDSLLIARQFGTSSNTGTGAIIEVTSAAQRGNVTSSAELFVELSSNGQVIEKPTSMTLNRDGSVLYIADKDRIWAMDMSTKSFELMTSSNLATGKKGEGPRLAASVTAMEVHPVYDILYVAAGAQGIIAIDLATGNRITVAR
ncbi:cytochrome c [Marinagarivorans cellulosilyticus]|uniref:cytochrome c n=1 Tax=Marinagarivorans cellulosilyticus TaxID=2721545 RepID=UPI001F3AA6CD|nr:cytochrome c [Marinagarivorans cellulosilyticus]